MRRGYFTPVPPHLLGDVTVGGEIMTPVQTSLAWSVGLFLGMLICLGIGYRIGSYGVEKHLDLAHEGAGTIEAAVFALLGLLLAFTFGGAMSRLEARRALIGATEDGCARLRSACQLQDPVGTSAAKGALNLLARCHG